MRPWIRAAQRRFAAAYNAGDPGGDYGPDYWVCKLFGVGELERSLQSGEPLARWTAPLGPENRG